MDKTKHKTLEIRPAHVLKPTKSEYRPTRFIFFDTETKQYRINEHETRHTLKLGHAEFWFYSERAGFHIWKERSFFDCDEFLDWIDTNCKTNSTTYLIAHNITFDLTVLGAFEFLPKRGWELESFYSKGLVSIYRWEKNGIRIIALDNTNFYAESLAKLGKRLGFPKLEVDFDNTDDRELLVYCQRDVEIMVKGFEVWFAFLDQNNCGAFKPTIASTAFNTWRFRFMHHTVHIHSDLLALELEREAYKGGRTECLWVGERDDSHYYYLDVNSMYGYILQSRQYPAGLWGSSDSASVIELAYKLKRYAVIARVTVDVSDNWFPVKVNDHTAYPLGQFTTTLTTPELKIAISQGWVKEVHALAWYRKHNIFHDYIEEFYQLRTQYKQEDNPSMEKIVKLLINGLYGKFGQLALKQEKIGECNPDIFRREQVYDMGEKVYYDQVYLGGSIFRERQEGESYHSFPAIAAHVTAHARVYLTWFLKQVPKGHAFYMDTDSLIVDQEGFESLKFYLDEHTLGMLKTEISSPWLRVNAPKDYAMDGRNRKKGIKSKAVQLDDNTYEQVQWPRLNGIIRKGLSREYVTEKITKQTSGVIWSGQVQPSGWISPFLLSLPEPVSAVHLFQHSERPE